VVGFAIEERRQAEEEGRDEDAEPTAYKTLDDVSRVEGMDDGTFLRNNGIDVGRDFAVRSMFFTVTVTARREKAMRQQRCVFQRHSKGCLTWATEVRAVTAADLPEFLGEEE
jgi:hypothetical protein